MITEILGLAPVVFWLALAVILAVFEIFTLGLSTIWFALGALCAFLCAMAGASIPLQIVIFIVASILSLLLVRPLSVKYLNSRLSRTNIDALIGRRVKVVKDIVNLEDRGAVSFDGTTWNARTVSGEDIQKGETVVINRIEGNKLFVTK